MKKKIFILISGVAIIALMVFNTQLGMNSNGESFTLFSHVMQASAQTEYGGGEIICSTGGQGKCYEECNWRQESDRIKCDCRATGDPNDYCIKLV